MHQHTEAQGYMREHTKYVCLFWRICAADSYMDEEGTKYSKPSSVYMSYLRNKLPNLCSNLHPVRDTVAAFDLVRRNLYPEDFDASGSADVSEDTQDDSTPLTPSTSTLHTEQQKTREKKKKEEKKSKHHSQGAK